VPLDALPVAFPCGVLSFADKSIASAASSYATGSRSRGGYKPLLKISPLSPIPYLLKPFSQTPVHRERLALSVQFFPDRHWQKGTSSTGFGQ